MFSLILTLQGTRAFTLVNKIFSGKWFYSLKQKRKQRKNGDQIPDEAFKSVRKIVSDLFWRGRGCFVSYLIN